MDLRVLMAQKHSKRWWKQAQKATSTPIGKSTTNLGIIPLIYWTMNRFQEPWKVGSMIGAYMKWLKNWGSKMWLMRFSRERCITRICMTVNPLFSEEKTQMASGEVRLTHSWLPRPWTIPAITPKPMRGSIFSRRLNTMWMVWLNCWVVSHNLPRSWMNFLPRNHKIPISFWVKKRWSDSMRTETSPVITSFICMGTRSSPKKRNNTSIR